MSIDGPRELLLDGNRHESTRVHKLYSAVCLHCALAGEGVPTILLQKYSDLCDETHQDYPKSEEAARGTEEGTNAGPSTLVVPEDDRRRSAQSLGRLSSIWSLNSPRPLNLSHLEAFLWTQRFSIIRKFFVIIYVAIPFFEYPSWCFSESAECGRGLSLHPTKRSNIYTPLGLPKMPTYASSGLELLCLLIFLVHIFLKTSYFRDILYWRVGWKAVLFRMASILFITISALECLVLLCSGGLVLSTAAGHYHVLRISTHLRPVIIMCLSRRIMKACFYLFRSIVGSIGIMLLIMAVALFYALLGVILFGDACSEPGCKLKYYSSTHDALVNTMMLIQLENMPDILFDNYYNNRFSALFFLSFIVLTQIILMNMLLATVYSIYRKGVKSEATVFMRRRAMALTESHRAMVEVDKVTSGTAAKGIPPSLIGEVVSIMSEQWTLRSISDRRNTLIVQHFDVMNRMCEHGIGRVEFAEIIELVRGPIINETFSSRALIDILCCQSKCGAFVRRMVSGRLFEIICQLHIAANTIVIVVESIVQASMNTTSFGLWFEIVEAYFTCFLAVEVTLKVLVYGAKYFKSLINIFEMILAVCLVGMGIIVLTMNNNKPFTLIVFTGMQYLRVLRLGRILLRIKRLRNIVSIAFSLYPFLLRYGGFIYVFLSMFTYLGIDMFGGYLARGSSWVAGTEYERSKQFLLNFNEFGSGIFSTVAMCYGFGWRTLLGVLEPHRGIWATCYFVAFYIMVIQFAFSLVLSVVLDTYNTLLPTLDKPQGSDENGDGPHTIVDQEEQDHREEAGDQSGDENVLPVDIAVARYSVKPDSQQLTLAQDVLAQVHATRYLLNRPATLGGRKSMGTPAARARSIHCIGAMPQNEPDSLVESGGSGRPISEDMSRKAKKPMVKLISTQHRHHRRGPSLMYEFAGDDQSQVSGIQSELAEYDKNKS